jgi:hypothetical protein
MPELGGRAGFWRRLHKRLQGKTLREYYGKKGSAACWTVNSNLSSSQRCVSECDGLRRAEETTCV